jgi:hypothetical protein
LRTSPRYPNHKRSKSCTFLIDQLALTEHKGKVPDRIWCKKN